MTCHMRGRPRRPPLGESRVHLQTGAVRRGHISALEPEQHKELLRNVVLTGGASCLAGLPERLEAALRLKASHAKGMPSIANQANRITIHTAPLPERRNGAWLGGSILASMASHTEFWMSRAEYDEHGASLAAQKGTHAFA